MSNQKPKLLTQAQRIKGGKNSARIRRAKFGEKGFKAIMADLGIAGRKTQKKLRTVHKSGRKEVEV